MLSRVTIELKLAIINNIKEANEFLYTYTSKYSNKFAFPVNYTTSVFEQVDNKLINSTLSIIGKRLFGKEYSIKYNKKIFLAYKEAQQVNFCRHTKCLVIKTFDDRLLCNVDDEI